MKMFIMFFILAQLSIYHELTEEEFEIYQFEKRSKGVVNEVMTDVNCLYRKGIFTVKEIHTETSAEEFINNKNTKLF